jgi:hypothetical protein
MTDVRFSPKTVTYRSACGPPLVYYEVGVNGFLGGVFGQGLDENIPYGQKLNL